MCFEQASPRDGRSQHDARIQFLDKKTIAELTARMYLDTGAVRFMTDKPFIFTSGWASPVYNDSRWLISFPDVRSTLMDFAVAAIDRDIGRDKIDAVAGGETAGIPFAAWVADRLQSADAICAQESQGLRPQRADRGPAASPASACCWSRTSPPTAAAR